MSDIDEEYYDDSRAATVGDLRLLYTKVQQLFSIALGLFFGTAAVVFSEFGGPGTGNALVLAVCAALMYFVAFAHDEGYSRRLLKRIPVNQPVKPAISERRMGDRTDEKTEVAD